MNCLPIRKLLAFVVLVNVASCNAHPDTAPSPANSEEHVFVVNLVPDSGKIKEYLDYHAHIWPEVEAGFRKAGYQEISLYRYSNSIVMRIKVPRGTNLDSMGKLAEASHPRCAEWNQLMATYQQGVAGTKPGQTWVEAAPIYQYGGQ
jgi:L-rhamnose mutarotase